MNGNSFRTLEFEKVKGLLLTHVGSAPGRQRLEALHPHSNPSLVREALATTSEAVALLRAPGRQPYHDLPDLRASLEEARVEGFHLEPAALLDVASFIEGAVAIAREVARAGDAPRLARLASEVRDTTEVAAAIRRAILPSGDVADDASAKLAETRRGLVRLRAQLTAVMESFLRGREAERLLQDKLITTRNDRYVLLVKAEQRGAFPGIIHGSSGSGASLFVEPLPAVELNNDVVSLQDEERREVIRILQGLTAQVGERASDLVRSAEILGELDAVQAMALLAHDMDAVAPEIWESERNEPQAARAAGLPSASASAEPAGSTSLRSGVTPHALLLDLKDARHPLLLSRLTERLGIARRSSREPVPVSIRVGPDETVLVISGPNTGGKTVALKTAGLLALMAQCGLHIPAAPGSVLPVFRRIYADIGDEQSIAADLSTFSAHLAAIVEMTRDLTLPALVLLDEVGAGTDPTEGGALGVAIVEHFRAQGATVLATTHHGLMKAYAQATPGVACASFGYDPSTYEPTYRLSLGRPGRSLALEMAERLGLPASVVADARSRRDEKEAQAEALLQKLEEERARLVAEEARIGAGRREVEAAQERQRAAERELATRKRSEVEAFVRELRKKGEEAARRAEEAIRQAVERLEASRRSTAEAARIRTDAVRAIREAQDEVLQDPELELPPEVEAPDAAVAVGTSVRVKALGVLGEVLALHGPAAEVAVAGKRLRVPRTELVAVPGRSARRPAVTVIPKPRSAGEVAAEINLVGLTVDEALPRVDKLLDEAALSERRQIRVIHGFGEGRLRRAVAGLLKGHPHVAAYRSGGAGEGGGGVTIVELKD